MKEKIIYQGNPILAPRRQKITIKKHVGPDGGIVYIIWHNNEKVARSSKPEIIKEMYNNYLRKIRAEAKEWKTGQNSKSG